MIHYTELANPEAVDPQLRNNKELAKFLMFFEEQWIIGTEHLLNPKHRMQLAAFGGLIDDVALRHTKFKLQIENCDS